MGDRRPLGSSCALLVLFHCAGVGRAHGPSDFSTHQHSEPKWHPLHHLRGAADAGLLPTRTILNSWRTESADIGLLLDPTRAANYAAGEAIGAVASASEEHRSLRSLLAEKFLISSVVRDTGEYLRDVTLPKDWPHTEDARDCRAYWVQQWHDAGGLVVKAFSSAAGRLRPYLWRVRERDEQPETSFGSSARVEVPRWMGPIPAGSSTVTYVVGHY